MGIRVGPALAKLTLLGFSLGLSLLLGELAVRVLGYQAIYEVYSKPDMLWQHDPLLGWSHEPDTKAHYVGPRPWPIEFDSEISINSLGLRGREPAPRTDGGLRVLALGDSMVAGFEVEDDETFSVIGSRLLGDALGTDVEIVNGGVRGYGTDQAYLYYRERGRALRPDVVLMWLSVNDLVDDVTIHRMRRIFGKPAFVPDGADGIRLVGSPVPDYPECSEYQISADGRIVRLDSVAGRLLCRLQMSLFDRSALFSFVTRLVPWEQWGDLLRRLYYLGMPDSSSPGPPRAAAPGTGERPRVITERILRTLGHDVEADGGRLVLISTPLMLRRFAEGGVSLDGFEVISLDEVEAADAHEVSFVHDSHLNAKGHRMVAEKLRESLGPILSEIRAARARGAATPDARAS